jgi:hypothetical protein
MPRGSGSGARQRFIIFSPLKVPAAGSAGSAGIRSSSSTSPGAPFLLFPEKLIVFYMIAFHELLEQSSNRAMVQVAKWRDFECWRRI